MHKSFCTVVTLLIVISASTQAFSSSKESDSNLSSSSGIILYEKPNISFGLSLPQQDIYKDSYGVEHQQTHDQLKERLDEDDNSFLQGVPGPLKFIEGLNFNFKFTF